MTKEMKAKENLEKDITVYKGKISFPSGKAVTYQKMKGTIQKFVELGGAPFTKKQIEDKMTDIGNVRAITKRVLPFLCDLGFIKRSRIGRVGKFTFKLNPEIRKRLEENPEEYNSILTSLSKKFPGYLIIWKYANEEKLMKFPVSAFEQQYLKSKLRLKFSSDGLKVWLNTLDQVKLLSFKKGFISLEGIPSPFEPPRKETQREPPRGTPKTGLPTSGEGVAPSMTFNVNIDLDYRQPPDLQRQFMTWLDKMSSKPNVRISIRQQKEEKKSKPEKETGQN